MQPVPFDIEDDEGDSDSDLDVRISERIRQTHRPNAAQTADQDALSSGDEAPLSRMNRRLKTSQNYITSFGAARLEARRERLERAARMAELDQAECTAAASNGDDYYGGDNVDRTEARRRKRTFFRNPTMTSRVAHGVSRLPTGPGGFAMLGGPDPRLESLGLAGEGIEYYEGPGKEMVAKEWDDGY